MNFHVEIDGVIAAAFTTVCGIEAEVSVVDYRSGSDRNPAPRKLPGEARYSNLILRRGLGRDLSLWNWMRETLNGATARRNIAIILLSESGTPVVRFLFRDAFPVKWTGPELNAQSSDVAIESLEIAHEGLSIEAPYLRS
jgi:phage tail-like protein